MERCPIRIRRLVPNWHPALCNSINRLRTHTHRLCNHMLRTSLRQGDLNDVYFKRRNRTCVGLWRKCLPTAGTAPTHCSATILTKSLHAIRSTMGTARPRLRPLGDRLTKLYIHVLLIPTMHHEHHTQKCVLRIPKIRCMCKRLHTQQIAFKAIICFPICVYNRHQRIRRIRSQHLWYARPNMPIHKP